MGTSSDHTRPRRPARWHTRPRRPAAPHVLAGAFLAVLTAIVAAGAPPAGATTPPGAATPPVGYDVAFPQCHEAASQYPAHPAFAIVGVNGGAPSADNPCLGPSHGQTGQLAWAAGSTGLWNQPRVSFYVIASDPGPGGAGWPGRTSGPQRCVGDWSHGCAYDYGYLRASSALRLARSVAFVDGTKHMRVVDPLESPWWLDVETDARWATARTPAWASLNIAAVAGFVDALESAGVGLQNIGFYSTSYQWRQITGLDAATSRAYFSTAHPDWVPGAKTLDQARSACAPTRSFSGGHVTLAQYASAGFDADYRCP